ncbi:DUF2442 domain-containing protein [Dyadobacter sp. CY261]|uniref:DUF2442 domain-containing protein n=1 Tax=Dyadobacter sp. CY261 TaxID=2907203 RepID=UPI001F1D3758|nr:DUF2442 domain-containing protein [Dyadobacter sp. CY261]MCF0075780.1 DUF2442 domain-containing protein [Dyadobacter sp. CY261]
MKDHADFQTEIDRLLTRYLQEVSQSNLKPLSAKTYQMQAINFVRWMKGDFKPGSGKRKKSPYNPSFEKKVKEARSSKAKGELITVNPENVWESIESGLERHSMEVSIKAVWFQADRIFIRTASGEERSMPLEWFPRIFNASQAEREQFELSAFGIHWSELDDDLSFEGFFTYSRP